RGRGGARRRSREHARGARQAVSAGVRPRPRGATALRVALAVAGLLLAAEVLAQLVAYRLWSTDWIGPSTPRPEALLFVGADETFDPGLRLRDGSWPC